MNEEKVKQGCGLCGEQGHTWHDCTNTSAEEIAAIVRQAYS